jgi:hypothetical protein
VPAGQPRVAGNARGSHLRTAQQARQAVRKHTVQRLCVCWWAGRGVQQAGG